MSMGNAEALEAAIATEIKIALIERGMDQKALADAVGIERATLSRYMTQKRSMPMPTFCAVAEALGLTPIALMQKAHDRTQRES